MRTIRVRFGFGFVTRALPPIQLWLVVARAVATAYQIYASYKSSFWLSPTTSLGESRGGEPLLASCRRPDDSTLYGEDVATAAACFCGSEVDARAAWWLCQQRV